MIIVDRIEATCESCDEEMAECIRIQMNANHVHIYDDCAATLAIMLNKEVAEI